MKARAKVAVRAIGMIITVAAFVALWLWLHVLVGQEWSAAREYFDVIFGALVGACLIELWLGSFRR